MVTHIFQRFVQLVSTAFQSVRKVLPKNSFDLVTIGYIVTVPPVIMAFVIFSTLQASCSVDGANKTVVLEEDTYITTSSSHIWISTSRTTASVTFDVSAAYVPIRYPRGTMILHRQNLLYSIPTTQLDNKYVWVSVVDLSGATRERIISRDEFELIRRRQNTPPASK